MNARERLLADIEAFLKRHDMTASEFGRLAKNDSALVGRLRGGASILLDTADRIRKFMSEYDSDPPTDQSRRPQEMMRQA